MVVTSSKFDDPGLMASTPPVVESGGVKVSCDYKDPAEPNCEVIYTSAPPLATFTSGGVRISVTTNTGLTDLAPYTEVHYPYVSTSRTQLFDLDSGSHYETTTTASTYQPVGSSTPIGVDIMPTDINVTTSAYTGGTTTTTVDTTTSYGDEARCPGHATGISVTDSYGNATAPAKTESLRYGWRCFLRKDTKTIVGLPSDNLMTLIKQYTPDGYGHPVSSTVSGTGVGARTTRMSYDPSERFPVSITNALGQTETLAYNDWGEKLSDTGANGDAVNYAYDSLGRLREQSGPEPAVSTNWSYSACSSCVADAAYEITQSGSDGSRVMTQYDELSRALRSVKLGFSGESVIQDTQYDFLGRVERISAPYKSGTTECWDTKDYDVLNRAEERGQVLKYQFPSRPADRERWRSEPFGQLDEPQQACADHRKRC